MKAFVAGAGRVTPWQPSTLPDQNHYGWVSLTHGEDEAHLPALLEASGLGPRFLAFAEQPSARARAMVAARGVAIALAPADPAEEPTPGHLILILTARLLISVAPSSYAAITWLEAHPEAALADGLDYLVFQLVSPLLDAYELRSERLVARVEAMEVAVLEAKAHLYGEMFHARREALRLRRLIEPALSVLELLRDHRFPGEEPAASPYLRDLVARLKRILAEVEAVRDGLAEMVEGYASVVANRLNRVMRFLTVLSTIFLPATLIASIYGMNFSIPEYHWPNGYAFSLALMIAVSGGLVLYMSRKGWFR
jgi:magnesium transporter